MVSVFCIFTADGVLADTGGYASITNSATNFGIFALRATGFRAEAYEFDVATITNVSATPTGRTILSVSGLGREPLEHYVVKIDGFRNLNPDIEYFVDVVEGVTVGPPFSAQITLESGSGGGAELIEIATGNPVSLASLVGETVRLHRPSIVNSSSHTWEYAGSGTSYLALPENGGVKVEANDKSPRTMVEHTFLELMNLVTSRLEHSQELKTELVTSPLLERLPSQKLNS